MNNRIIKNWRDVLKKAWSVRLMIVAAVLSGIEIILPLFVDQFPRHVFAILSFVTVMAAFASRFVAQKSLNEEPGE